MTIPWRNSTCSQATRWPSALLAALQAGVRSIGFALLSLNAAARSGDRGPLAIGNALLGMSLGLLLSAFAAPSSRLCNSCPRSDAAAADLRPVRRRATRWHPVLERVSAALPSPTPTTALTRAADDDLGRELAVDALVIAGCIVAALVLGATTLRRRTA